VAQKNYESLIGVKENEMATLVDARKKKEGEKADAEKDLADNSQDLDDTTKQMKADTVFFDETKAACQAKADEWSERVRARTEELAGINKALEILTSDDAKALFNKSIKPGKETFLQIDSESKPEAKAYKALKEHATKAKSLRLAAIAATLRTGGHFDAVIAEIDKMMATLKAEEKGDIEQRDWCKEETFKNEQEASRYEYKIERTAAKIMKLTSKREELESTLAATVQSILNTKDDIKAMEDARKEQHAAFESAKSDDEGAVKLLAAAIESMTAFYKNNKIGMGDIQGAAQALVQEPVFEVSADQAPDASFTSAGKSSGESKGIVSIMTMIKEDLEDEISNGVKSEGETQAKFEEQLGDANTLLDELRAKKTNLEQAISDTNTEIDENDVHKEDLQGLLKEEKDYLASIKPDCDWILNSFTERRTKRAAEMEGLLQAKGMLAGASPAMMQSSVEFDDSEFPQMKFSGASFLQKQQ
jgi:DNA repair exonuclease SbcCD ATPase subunit